MSNTLSFEYTDVLMRKLSLAGWNEIELLLKTLLLRAEFVKTYFTWRPSSPGPGDEHIIDCAVTAGVPVVTFNLRDFREAHKLLGLIVMTPAEAVAALAQR